MRLLLISRRRSITHRKSIDIETDEFSRSPNSEIGLDSSAICLLSASYSNRYYGRHHAAGIFRLYVFLSCQCPPNKKKAKITVFLRPKELHRGLLLTLEDSRCADADGSSTRQSWDSTVYPFRYCMPHVPLLGSTRESLPDLLTPQLSRYQYQVALPSVSPVRQRWRGGLPSLILLAADVCSIGQFHRRLNSPQAGNECTVLPACFDPSDLPII